MMDELDPEAAIKRLRQCEQWDQFFALVEEHPEILNIDLADLRQQLPIVADALEFWRTSGKRAAYAYVNTTSAWHALGRLRAAEADGSTAQRTAATQEFVVHGRQLYRVTRNSVLLEEIVTA